MKLFTELHEDIQYLVEDKDGKKTLYIDGVFMEYGVKNKNGRMYSESVMRNGVDTYIKEYVQQKRAYGELNHPQGPQINLDRVSHIIESLKIQPNGQVIGKARIVDTPCGNIVKGLIEGGARLGVSSRGLGSLKQGDGIMEVQNDFRLVTAADIVADPSAPNAFVQGIMEGVEYAYNEKTGQIVESIQKQVKKISTRELNERKLDFFRAFLKQL